MCVQDVHGGGHGGAEDPEGAEQRPGQTYCERYHSSVVSIAELPSFWLRLAPGPPIFAALFTEPQ